MPTAQLLVLRWVHPMATQWVKLTVMLLALETVRPLVLQ